MIIQWNPTGLSHFVSVDTVNAVCIKLNIFCIHHFPESDIQNMNYLFFALSGVIIVILVNVYHENDYSQNTDSQ